MVARLGCGVSGMLHPVTRARPLEQNRRSWGPGGARLPWQIFSRRCTAEWGRARSARSDSHDLEGIHGRAWDPVGASGVLSAS